jgi:hypothetical protein
VVAVLLVPLILLALFAVVTIASERRFKNAGYDRRRQPPGRCPEHSFAPTASVRLKGGARIGWWNATWPLATLVLDKEWAHLKSMIGSVWISQVETIEVKVVRSPVGSGVLFSSRTGVYDGVIFWTFSPAAVREALANFGWPVSD